MTHFDPQTDLATALALYLTAQDEGQSATPEDWVARFPHLREELQDFFSLDQLMESLTSPLRNNDGSTSTSFLGNASFLKDDVPFPIPFGAYDLLELIGRGGMGLVFRAKHRQSQREVALKMIRSGPYAPRTERERFRREIDVSARLNHPNIVPIWEIGEVEGQPFYTMKLLLGGTLQITQAERDPFSVAKKMVVLAQAVFHAHQRGVLHRDLKPSNILRDEEDRLHLVDFGLARLTTGSAGLTQTGDSVGTPAYMAPEQADGSSEEQTTATDIHGLGAVFYTLLTAQAPFSGATTLAVLDQVRNHDPISPRLLNSNVPVDLEAICLKCLRKNPADRYATAQDLANDLDNAIHHRPIQARLQGRWERLWKRIRRHPRTTVAIGGAFGVMLTFVLVLIQKNIHVEQLNTELKQSLEREKNRQKELMLENYLNRIRFAGDLWREHRYPEMVELLERLRNQQGEEDLRGFVWRYLWNQAQGRFSLEENSKANVLHSPETLQELTPLVGGHPPEAWTVAFSPDGRRFASGGDDHKIRIWDFASRKQIAKLSGHSALVMSVCFTPDGKHLISGSWDKRIRIWDLETQQSIAEWRAHDQPVRHALVTPDGSKIVSQGREGKIRVWDRNTCQELQSIPSFPGIVQTLTISPDGKHIGYMHSPKRIGVASLENPSERIELPVKGSLNAVIFGKQPHQLIAADLDGKVDVWNFQTQSLIRSWKADQRHVCALLITPDGKSIVSGTTEGAIRFHHLNTGQELLRFGNHPKIVKQIAFSPNGENMLVAYLDGSIRFAVAPRD